MQPLLSRLSLITLLTIVPCSLPSAKAQQIKPDPFWPHVLSEIPDGVSKQDNKRDSATVLAWTPPGAERIRALILIPVNSDSKHVGEHPAVRAAAAKHTAGIVYFRYAVNEWKMNENPSDRSVPIILDALAEKTGMAEFSHAPWITFGKSSRGKFPFFLAWAYPERTIATISYHAEAPTWPPEQWARMDGNESILHLSVNGETEWGGTWHRHVRPQLLNYRGKTRWLPHMVVSYDVGHGNYVDSHGSQGWGKEFPGQVTCRRVWDYIGMFIDKALAARLPENGYPTEKPLALRQVDPSAGYAIHPFAVEAMFNLPRFDLKETEGLYVSEPEEEKKPLPLLEIEPARNYQPPEGVPLVPMPGQGGLSEWIFTDGLDYSMKEDPMKGAGDFARLRPRPGEKVRIDDIETTFQRVEPNPVKPDGSLQMFGVFQKRDKVSMLAYSVITNDKPATVKINAPYTASGRVQMLINSTPVAHGQIAKLAKGLYPVTLVIRLRTRWQTLYAGFEKPSADEIAAAREVPVEQTAGDEQDSEDLAEAQLIRKVGELDASQRERWFWIPDRELADAWLDLHRIE